MNIFDILILFAVGIALFLAIRKLRKNTKNGKSPCGCDCGHCNGCGKAEK